MKKNKGFYFQFIIIFRESTEETLLALLEDTCNKVNAA